MRWSRRGRYLQVCPADRRDLVAAGMLLITTGVRVVLFFWDPATHPGPGCPTKSLQNLDGPGFGSMRAAHQLLHLNFPAAFRYNPLMVLLGLSVAGWALASQIAARRCSAGSCSGPAPGWGLPSRSC